PARDRPAGRHRGRRTRDRDGDGDGDPEDPRRAGERLHRLRIQVPPGAAERAMNAERGTSTESGASGKRGATRLTTLPEAAAGIPDGALVTFGGFDLNRAPMALVREIVRQKRRGLRLVSPPNPLPLDFLVGAGAAASIDFGYLGFQYEHGFVVAPNVRRAIER